MDSAELLARAKQFAVNSLSFYRKLSKAPEAQVPGVQFYRAATSAWMNYRSSKRGRSRPDFISKLGIAVEEIDEAAGWLVDLSFQIQCPPSGSVLRAVGESRRMGM
jgi:four helix bundle protein